MLDWALIPRVALSYTVLFAVICASVAPAAEVDWNCAAHKQSGLGQQTKEPRPCCCGKGEQRSCACKPNQESPEQPSPMSEETRVVKVTWLDATSVSYVEVTQSVLVIPALPVVLVAASRSIQSLLCIWRI